MARHTITLDLSGDELAAAPATLRRAAVSPYSATDDAALFATLANAFEHADTSFDDDPVEIEFTPRGEQGAA